MFGLGLQELIVILVILGIPAVVFLIVLLYNNLTKRRLIQSKGVVMAYCTKCGKEVVEGSSFCQNCGEKLSNLQSGIQNPAMSSMITDEDLTTFIGTNATKYLTKFKKFNIGGIDNFGATWHWPAFFVPFWWMLYRKIYGWAVLAFFIGIIPYVGLFSGIVWAIMANYIYYRHAKRKLLEIKQLHPSPETQKAVIAVTGGVGNVALLIGVLIGLVAVIGILAAIAIPGHIGMQERSRKGAITRTATSAQPELQSWLNASVKKGENANLREQDTDGNGVINENDLTNSELLNKGACTQYVMLQNSIKKEKSPWDSNVELWTTGTGKGQIACIQSDSSIELTLFDKNGTTIETKTIIPQY